MALSSGDARVPVALGWALSGTGDSEQFGLIPSLADRAIALDGASSSAKELKGWGYYVTGSFAEAETYLKQAYYVADAEHGADSPKLHPDSSAEIVGYRLGLVLFAQGPSRYAEAKSLLEQGQTLTRSDGVLFASARQEIRSALADIRKYDVEQARLARETKRNEAIRQRQAEREARERAKVEAKAARDAQKAAEKAAAQQSSE